MLIQDNITPGPTYSISAATNQLNRWYGPVNEYTYDAAGNLINSGTSDIGGHTFTYNALSQITAVDVGTTATYSYNGRDERALKQTGASWTGYVYFNGQPLAEYDNTGAWTDYIYAEGQKIAKIVTPLTGSATLNYYLDDHLGTTQVELDASGNVTWQGQFTPFGAELPDGSTAMHYKFTGKERDAESGLDFFGARYYASTTGRWMSPDSKNASAHPENPQTWNRYAYVDNNPLIYSDPDGREKKLTIYVEQPVFGTRAMSKGGNDYGHAFIGLRDTDTMKTDHRVGFYPRSKWDLVGDRTRTVPGKLKNDDDHHWNIKMTYTISDEAYNKLKADINHEADEPQNYNMISNNCATWVINEAARIGLMLPKTMGKEEEGKLALDPGDLGQDLRDRGAETNPDDDKSKKKDKSDGDTERGAGPRAVGHIPAMWRVRE